MNSSQKMEDDHRAEPCRNTLKLWNKLVFTRGLYQAKVCNIALAFITMCVHVSRDRELKSNKGNVIYITYCTNKAVTITYFSARKLKRKFTDVKCDSPATLRLHAGGDKKVCA